MTNLMKDIRGSFQREIQSPGAVSYPLDGT